MDGNHMHVVDIGWGSMAMQPEMGLSACSCYVHIPPKVWGCSTSSCKGV